MYIYYYDNIGRGSSTLPIFSFFLEGPSAAIVRYVEINNRRKSRIEGRVTEKMHTCDWSSDMLKGFWLNRFGRPGLNNREEEEEE